MIDQQLDRLQSLIHELLTTYFFNDPATSSTQFTAWVELPTIQTIISQIIWVEKYLNFYTQHCTDALKMSTSSENKRFDILQQIKRLFHREIYVRSIEKLLQVMTCRINNPIPSVHPLIFSQILKHIAYVQSYSNLCLLPDLCLNAKLVAFNRCILEHFSENFPHLAVVEQAYQTIANTNASADYIPTSQMLKR